MNTTASPRFFGEFWSLLPEHSRPTMPSIEFHAGFSGGYSRSRHLIVIGYGEAECRWTEPSPWSDHPNRWRTWVVEFVEEVAHCVAETCHVTPSEEAIEAHSKFGPNFDGDGHHREFFEALLIIAKAIGCDGNKLVCRVSE